MRNPFCISKNKLKKLIEIKTQERLFTQIKKFKGSFALEEMFEQMENGSGIFDDSMIADTTKFTSKTENVEAFLAIDLSDFYFPNEESEICFEMKSGFSIPVEIDYDTLIKEIECDTHIDCSVRSKGKVFNFQIKRYPQAHLEHTTESLTKYIKETVNGYGNMAGSILIILLQPNTETPSEINFKEIHKNIMSIKDKISFEEINFLFNDKNQYIMWHQVFPECGHCKKPLVLLSERYQKEQEKWKDK
mgnify:CR=1 FL=1